MKGQLGIGSNENRKKPSLIYSLLPSGNKNPKSNFFLETSEYKKKIKKSKEDGGELTNITNLMSKLSADDNEKQPVFLLMQDEYIKSISCGPLHTLMVSNKNRLFSCGYG